MQPAATAQSVCLLSLGLRHSHLPQVAWAQALSCNTAKGWASYHHQTRCPIGKHSAPMNFTLIMTYVLPDEFIVQKICCQGSG